MNPVVMTSVRLPFSGKIKYNVPLAGGGGSRPLRLYDFRLASASSLEYTDLNSLWLCVGRDPVNRCGGAWLLTSAYEVTAFLPTSTLTEFNKNEGKTYLRMWFVADNASGLPYDMFKYYIVRVALLTKPDEMFLTLGPAPSTTQTGPLKFMNAPPKLEQWKLFYPPVLSEQQQDFARKQDFARQLSQSQNPPPHQAQPHQAQRAFNGPPYGPPGATRRAQPYVQPYVQPQASAQASAQPQPQSAASRVIYNPWGEQNFQHPPPPSFPPPAAQAPAAVPAQAVPVVSAGFSCGGLDEYEPSVVVEPEDNKDSF